ncbi:MAG: DUF192 domain-containing protein [Myxococcales bacterium]|nr:DUF192 domain-containing protein [Myxococcales bacterium]
MGMRSFLLLLCALGFACTSGSGDGASPATPSTNPRSAHHEPGTTGGGAAAAPEQSATPLAESGTVMLMPLPLGREPIPVRVEVARSPEERRQGLMFRKHLDEDAGMFFIFERPSALSFWMRNTYIPLDIMFIDSELRVVGIVENAEPETDTSRRVPGLSQYVLEVNGGFSQKHGIEAGTQLKLEGIELP